MCTLGALLTSIPVSVLGSQLSRFRERGDEHASGQLQFSPPSCVEKLESWSRMSC